LALDRGPGLRLGAADVAALKTLGDTIVYRPGDVLYNAGAAPEYCHLVVRGVIELVRHGEKTRVVSRVRSGGFAGEIAVLLGVPYLSSARAATYAEAFWMERNALQQALAERPAITYGWLMSAMATLADTHGHLEVVLGPNARAQVAGALLAQMDGAAHVEISQTGLASLLGVGRQTINRALGELAEMGLVRTGYRMIEILDPAGLDAVYRSE
jgi:CRP-like cAMP-binding protein